MKKLFTLLTLALISIGSAWGDEITVTWLPDGSSLSVTSTKGTASVDGILTVADVTASSDIKAGPLSKDYSTGGTHYYGYYTPTTATGTTGAYSKDDYITFAVTVKEGYTFTPTSATLQAIGIGTGNQGAQIFATIQTANGTNTLGKGDSKTQAPTTLTLNSFSSTSYSAGETLYFYVHLGSKDSDKSVGFRDVILTGTYAIADTRNPLTLSFTPDNQTIGIGGTLTTSFINSTDISGESAKYSVVTYTSSDDAIATVSPTGVVTGVAEGSATITATITADADATYKTTNATIIVNVITPFSWNASYGVPTGTLDMSNSTTASTALNGVSWNTNYGSPLFNNDGDNNYFTSSVVTLYSSDATWVKAASGSSAGASWSATDIFQGGSAYMTDIKAATVSTGDNLYYAFRVKGVTKIKAYAKSNAGSQIVTLAAFELTGSTPAASTINYSTCGNTETVIEVELDDSKEYVITLTNNGGSNSRLYEMAFFYDEAVALYETVTPAKEYTTYVTKYAVDFTGLGVKGYIATAASASSVTLEEVTKVPAKTPLVLKGTASTEYKLPVCATVAAPASNLLKAGDGATKIGGDGKYDYILSDGKFYHASPAGPVAVGKAYLHLDDEPAAGREFLEIEIDGYATGINMVNGEGLKVNGSETYYDLQGRRVLYPTKGLYIVNGKKVVIK